MRQRNRVKRKVHPRSKPRPQKPVAQENDPTRDPLSKKFKPRCDEEQLAILRRCSEKKDITEWHDYRKNNPDTGIWLQGADLMKAHLEGANLWQAHLEGAYLPQAHLERAVLQQAHLERAYLPQAHLEGANLWDAHLEGAYLRSAHLEGAYLLDAHLERAVLPQAHLERAVLQQAHLERAVLQQAHLERAVLQLAHLEGANLRSAHLERAVLQLAHLEGANLRSAHLEGAVLQQAHLQGANLGGAHLEGAELEEAHLEGAELEEAHLEGAELEEAHLEGANLGGAHLEGAELEEAHLEGADLTGSSLQTADCSWCIVDGETVFKDCHVDIDTGFTGVGLDAARVDPGIKQLLQYNVRRKRWEAAYAQASSWQGRIVAWVTRRFWQISDYGLNSRRILDVFMRASALFALLYVCLLIVDVLLVGNTMNPGVVSGLLVPEMLSYSTIWDAFHVLARSLYFSVVTMTTLGFGDLHANPASCLWPLSYFLLSTQVILGYVLLGALITRFAILFTAGGPTGTFTPMSEKRRQYTDLAVKLGKEFNDTAKRELIAQIQALQDNEA